jgi:hypothetical protein
MVKNHIRRMEALVRRLAAELRRAPAPARRRLQTAQDVVDLLEEQVEMLRADSRAGSVEKARALGYLASIARQAIETGSLAARIEALEQSTGTQTAREHHQS